MFRILAETFPNGELRLRTVIPHAKKRDPNESSQNPLKVALGKAFERGPLDNKHEFQERNSDPVKKSSTHDSATKPGWGGVPSKTKFTKRARNTILRVGGAMEKLGGVVGLITLTLPADHQDAFRAIANYSGFVANRIKTWLFDQVRDTEKFSYFYSWELQKRGALHMHLCLRCDDNRIFSRVAKGIKTAWINALETVEKKSGVGMFLNSKGYDNRRRKRKIQVDIRKASGSICRYLAKYVSKHDKTTQSHIEKGIRPSRWWGCSRFLLNYMRDNSQKIITGLVSQEEYNRLIIEIADICDEVESFHLNQNFYNKQPYIVAYPGEVLGRALLNHVEARTTETKFVIKESCKNMDANLRKRVKQIGRRFNTDREILRIAEIIKTDSPEWEIFCRIILEDDCLTDLQVDKFINVLETEGIIEDWEIEKEDEFFIPQQLNTSNL